MTGGVGHWRSKVKKNSKIFRQRPDDKIPAIARRTSPPQAGGRVQTIGCSKNVQGKATGVWFQIGENDILTLSGDGFIYEGLPAPLKT